MMSHNPSGAWAAQVGYASPLTQGQAAAQQQAMYNQAMNQSAILNHYASQQAIGRWQAEWVLNGEILTFKDFINKIWPEDCPEKTFFVLKYKPQEISE